VINQCTKFEVSRFTHYETMNGGAKCKNAVVSGDYGQGQGRGQCHRSIERIGLRLPIRL